MKFDLTNINPVSAYQITKMISSCDFNADTLKEEVIARKGEDSTAWVAPAVLCEWCIAVENYERIERSVKPLSLKYRDSKDEKTGIDDKIFAIENEISGYRARISEIEDIFASRG